MQTQAQRTRPPRRRKPRGVAATFPRLVIFYNRWTDFESHEIRKQFRPMTAREFRAIAVGDEVWMSEDPIHPNGKVYGYARRRITKVERTDGGIRLHFVSGFTTVSTERPGHPCYAVDHPLTLTRLVGENPLATQVSAY